MTSKFWIQTPFQHGKVTCFDGVTKHGAAIPKAVSTTFVLTTSAMTLMPSYTAPFSSLGQHWLGGRSAAWATTSLPYNFPQICAEIQVRSIISVDWWLL